MHNFGDNFDFIRLYLIVIIIEISIERALIADALEIKITPLTKMDSGDPTTARKVKLWFHF